MIVDAALDQLRLLATVGAVEISRAPMTRQTLKKSPDKPLRTLVRAPTSAKRNLVERKPAPVRSALGQPIVKIKQVRRDLWSVQNYAHRSGNTNASLYLIKGPGASSWQLHSGFPRRGSMLHTTADLDEMRNDMLKGRVKGVVRSGKREKR